MEEQSPAKFQCVNHRGRIDNLRPFKRLNSERKKSKGKGCVRFSLLLGYFLRKCLLFSLGSRIL